MRLIVLSDTHSEILPRPLLEDIKKSDLIIHVGDFCDMDIYKGLKALKDIRSVYGNMDGLELRAIMPRKAVFACGKVIIGLVHGEGSPEMVLDRVREAFKGDRVNAVVFGHSHQPCNEVINGVLYFNPGSPTDTIRAAYRSYGILEVAGDTVKGRIVKIK